MILLDDKLDVEILKERESGGEPPELYPVCIPVYNSSHQASRIYILFDIGR